MNPPPDSNGESSYILIVEDSLAQAEFLRRTLEYAHFQVVAAANGAEALDLLELRLPELIISDVMMPVMNGYELCRKLKADERFRTVPFMLLTSLSDPQDIFQGLESGADFYSVKPYEAESMLKRVRDILDSASAHHTTTTVKAGMNVTYQGQKYSVLAGRSQIMDLLLATFERVVKKNQELVETNHKLTEALEHNKTLRGLIPICGYCKKIRDDQGYWDQVESFVAKHSEAKFSHGICPQCFDKTMLEINLLPKKCESQSLGSSL